MSVAEREGHTSSLDRGWFKLKFFQNLLSLAGQNKEEGRLNGIGGFVLAEEIS